MALPALQALRADPGKRRKIVSIEFVPGPPSIVALGPAGILWQPTAKDVDKMLADPVARCKMSPGDIDILLDVRLSLERRPARESGE
jgi:hypothetical protein